MSAGTIGARQQWAPPPNAQVDWTHPLAQRLVVFWVHGPLPAIIGTGGRVVLNSTSFTSYRGPAGAGGRTVSGQAYVSIVPRSYAAGVATGAASVVCSVAALATPSATAWLLAPSSQSGGSQNACGGPGFTSGMLPTVRIGTGSFGDFTMTGSSALTVGQWYTMAAVSRPGNHELFVDGARVASSTDSRSTDVGSEYQIFGDNNPFSGNIADAAIAWGAVWARGLLADEIAQVVAQPFGFLRY